MAKFKPGNKGSFGDRSRSRFGGGSRDRGRNRGEDRESFGDRSKGFGRGGDRGKIEMYDVICDKCGKNCEVPFKPTTGKPVLCSDCFRQNDRGSGSRGFSNQRRPFPSQTIQSGASSEQLKQINEKLDKIIKTLQELEMTDDSEDEEEQKEEEGITK